MPPAPTTRVTVRPAVRADDAALLELDQTGWTSGSGFPSMLRTDRIAFFDEKNTPDLHLVADFGGRLAGYLRLVPATPIPENAHVLGVFGLVVAEDARRHGVASALLEAAERRARSRRARKLTLRVLATNTPALALYERHGYVVEGRYVQEFLIDGTYVDDLAMAKRLVR